MFLPEAQNPALGPGMQLGGRALPQAASPTPQEPKKQSLQKKKKKRQIAKHSLGKQRQENLGEFKISLDYIMNSRPARST